MRWKITNRFLAAMITIVLIVFIINTAILLYFLMNRSYSNPEKNSPETFTRQFSAYITIKDEHVSISERGKKRLQQKNAWIQILNAKGEEVYRFLAPEELPTAYTPTTLIQHYKYRELPQTTMFFSEKKQFSYAIGIKDSNFERISLTLHTQDIVAFIGKNLLIFLIVDVLIALLVGLFFGQKLTKPMLRLIDGIHTLRNRQFKKMPVQKGVYKEVFDNVNDLAVTLDHYEQQQRQHEKMRNEWISNVSHDMKTPLASIRGYAELLKDRPTEDEIEKYSRIIEEKAIYMNDLLDDLNLTTKLQNQAMPLRLETKILQSTVKEWIIELLNNDASNTRDLQFDAIDEPLTVSIDEKLTKRAFQNFIENAFMHNDADVTVNVSITNSYPQHLSESSKKLSTDEAYIMISDNGNGISEQDLANIFTRYYRGSNTTDTKGTGLGMAIGRDIIQAEHGDVHIFSTVQRGTTVIITLPLL